MAPLGPMILGLIAPLALIGCQYADKDLSPATTAALVQTAAPHPAEQAAREELGDEAAEAMDIQPRRPPAPTEPGALALVVSMTAGMPDRAVDEQGLTRIGLHYLRNQSRADAEEFDRFTVRLADLLSAAGSHLSTAFTTSFDEPVQYELLGTAYLITADGFDQWELFLRLSPAEESWTIWQTEAPVRVIRDARPGAPQITQWPLPR